MRGHLRLLCVGALSAGLALTFPLDRPARAQTADYFSTPWIVAPETPSSNSPAAAAITAGNTSATPRSGLYARKVAQSAPDAPPWTISGHIGIDEIATDNAGASSTDRTADLGSLFSAGVTGTADMSRFQGILSATGVYRRQIEDSALNGFAGYGYARGQATLVRDFLFLGVRGFMDDISREPGGLQNPIVQSPQATQIYSISGSPVLYNLIGDFGLNVLRYQIGQAWFAQNSAALQQAPINIPPLTASTDQSLREDLKMAGTVFPRLLSDISLSAADNNSGSAGSGNFMRDRGELINEYEITRSVSVLGGGGYERLHDPAFPVVNGEGAVWDGGVRLRPNPDSYALLTYGHHDLKSDFAGELVWRVTPFTDVYAAYTDSITNVQQTLIGNNETSELGPEGTTTHVTFDESTLIGTLDDELLNASPGGEVLTPLGVSVTDINNALPLQNGLFRIKSFRATAHTTVSQSPLSLTLLHLDSTQLTAVGFFGGAVGETETSTGAILSWTPQLARQLAGLASLQYFRVRTTDEQQFQFPANQNSADRYGVSLGLTQVLSNSMTGILRYDFIYSNAQLGSASYYQNAVTIGIHKTFD